jgi:hypothetical protein
MCRLSGVGVRHLASFDNMSPDILVAQHTTSTVTATAAKNSKAKDYSRWNVMSIECVDGNGNVVSRLGHSSVQPCFVSVRSLHRTT